MKKWLFRIFWIPLLLGAVLFLVANRALVAISLDPFSTDNPALATPALPLWFWLIMMLFIGFAVGILGMWVSARSGRQRARDDRKTIKALRAELGDVKSRLRRFSEESGGEKRPASDAPLLEAADA